LKRGLRDLLALLSKARLLLQLLDCVFGAKLRANARE
jgi:hypothetical protein